MNDSEKSRNISVGGITLEPACAGFSRGQVTGLAASGGLLSCGPSTVAIFRQLGVYAGRILSGGKAADLPVEEPAKIELGINLRTARVLGLTVPTSLLARADVVIE